MVIIIMTNDHYVIITITTSWAYIVVVIKAYVYSCNDVTCVSFVMVLIESVILLITIFFFWFMSSQAFVDMKSVPTLLDTVDIGKRLTHT